MLTVRAAGLRILKPGWMLTIISAAGLISAQSASESPPWNVILNLENTRYIPAVTLEGTKPLSAEMLAPTGVRLFWNSGMERVQSAACDPRSLSITVVFESAQSTPLRLLDAVGYTTASTRDGARITIVYDRLPQRARHSPRRSAPILAHALVHEITHVLQLANHHSSSGIMKARWTVADYAEMEDHRLAFEAEDLRRIDVGRATWARRCAERLPGP